MGLAMTGYSLSGLGYLYREIPYDLYILSYRECHTPLKPATIPVRVCYVHFIETDTDTERAGYDRARERV